MLRSLVAFVLALCLFVVSAAFADPLLLSDPMPAAGPALNGVAIGGAPHGFLLAGTGSHRPAAVPLNESGRPRLIGVSLLGPRTASAVGEPVFVGDRWIVPISPDHLSQDRFFLAEVRDDGTLLREPRVYSWPRIAFAQIAARPDGLVVIGTRSEGVNNYTLVVRTLSADLETLGEENVIAQGMVFSGAFVRFFRVVPAPSGFLLTYVTGTGLHVARLSTRGELLGEGIVISTANSIVSPDIAAIGSDAMVVWAELISPGSWSLRSARVSNKIDFLNDIAMIQGGEAPAVFLRRTKGDVFYVVWQGIDNTQGRRVGGTTYVQWLSPEARPERGMRQFPGQGEVLVGAASSGFLLLAWEKHLVGVGVSLDGVVLARDISLFSGIETNRGPLRLAFREPQSVALSANGDGTFTAAWVEKSSTESVIFIGRYDRDGKRQKLVGAGRSVRSVDIAAGAGVILVVWDDGSAVRGLILDNELARLGPVFAIDEGINGAVLEPHVTWDGSRFVVVWRRTSQIAAAFVSPSANGQLLGAVATLPSSEASDFHFRMPRVAANATGIVVAASVQEIARCGFPFCSERNYLAVLRLNEKGERLALDLQPVDSDPMSNVATDGEDFLVIWKTENDVRTRVISDSLPVDRVLLEWRSTFRPEISWSGSDYVASWTYLTGDTPNIAAAMLDRSGNVMGAARTVRNAGVSAVAAFPGDALLGWVGSVTGDQHAEAVYGEFFSSADAFLPKRRAIGRR